MLFADERAHFGFSLEWWSELDTPGLLGDRFDEFRIYLFLDENPASCGADLALVNEDPEERAIDSRFPICAIEKNVRRLPSKLQSYAFETAGGSCRDKLSNGRTSRKCDLVNLWMRHQGGPGAFPKAVDDIYHAWGQS